LVLVIHDDGNCFAFVSKKSLLHERIPTRREKLPNWEIFFLRADTVELGKYTSA
jgi:hypothetical protein